MNCHENGAFLSRDPVRRGCSAPVLAQLYAVWNARIQRRYQQVWEDSAKLPRPTLDETKRESSARMEVPFCGCENLIAPDMAVGNLHAMRKKASGGPDMSEAGTIAFWQGTGRVRADFVGESSHFRQALRCFDALSKEAGGQASPMLGDDRADQRIVDAAREWPRLPWFAQPFRLRNEAAVRIGSKTALERRGVKRTQ